MVTWRHASSRVRDHRKFVDQHFIPQSIQSINWYNETGMSLLPCCFSANGTTKSIQSLFIYLLYRGGDGEEIGMERQKMQLNGGLSQQTQPSTNRSMPSTHLTSKFTTNVCVQPKFLLPRTPRPPPTHLVPPGASPPSFFIRSSTLG